MSTPNHPLGCHCSLHAQLEARRHHCYRQLAQAILGPGAPKEDFALANALADHAGLSETTGKIIPLRPRRAA
jgi:hypothetical protein